MSDYNLDELGWHQFEQLCQALLKALMGPQVLAWGGNGDWGRDAYCSSAVQLWGAQESVEGPIVFQAKFVEHANAAGARPEPLLTAAVNAELRRIAERTGSGQWETPNAYVLLTNASVNPPVRRALTEAMAAAELAANCQLWDGNDIGRMLDAQPNVRLAYPQILGLRDLTGLIQRALNHGHHERARAVHLRASELARTFVAVPAYYEALRVLSRHHFVVLTGAPEMGKSTIGYLIGLAKMTDDWLFYVVEQPRDFFDLVDEDEHQVFLVDDAFGSTEYRPDQAERWASNLDHMLRRCDATHWAIFTSRSAPLQIALSRLRLDGRAEMFPDPGRVVVDTGELDTVAKAQILYRHAKSAALSSALIALVRAQAARIVESRHFTPERIRYYVDVDLPKLSQDPMTTDDREIMRRVLQRIENPTRRMRQSFEALSPEHRACLVALLEVGATYHNADRFRAAVVRHSGITDPAKVDRIVDELGEHFLRFEQPSDGLLP